MSKFLLVPAAAMGDPLGAAVAAIDWVHGDGLLPPITVSRAAMPPNRAGRYDPRPPYKIVVGENAGHPGLTLLHEIGHVLDQHGIGVAREFASIAGPSLGGWRAAVHDSQAFEDLAQRLRSTIAPGPLAGIRYLLRPEELWARSFAQYVARQSGDSALVVQLDARRQRPLMGRYIPSQWDEGDFDPIAAAIDALF